MGTKRDEYGIMFQSSKNKNYSPVKPQFCLKKWDSSGCVDMGELGMRVCIHDSSILYFVHLHFFYLFHSPHFLSYQEISAPAKFNKTKLQYESPGRK